jgi:uncharacterized radical SAM protein YgiQ
LQKENAESETNDLVLYSHEDCISDKRKFAESFKQIEIESNKIFARRIIQPIGNQVIIVNPPYSYLTQDEIDLPYNLPYTRLPHPRYWKKEPIPAFEMIKFSVNIHRGCFGGCAFCTLSAHQGKMIQSRSEKSILKEVEKIVEMPDFKGNLSDLGGPSANMYGMQGKDLTICEKCSKPSCIFPTICNNLNTNHQKMLDVYKKVQKIDGIKRIFVGSGIRYDLLFNKLKKLDPDKIEYLRQLIRYHVSGRLKVAPEHTSDEVLKIMRKPSFEQFKEFKKLFDVFNREFKLNQQLIPYFISSHPGCEDMDMAELAAETKTLDFKLEQVQDFTPTPMTLASTIYYSGIDPYTGKQVYTAKDQTAKRNQRKYFFWYEKEYKDQIRKELQKKGRFDLIKKLFGG